MMATATRTNMDRDFQRIFFGDRQVDVTHFFAINWTEDTETPIRFAFGYWTHDGVFHQGTVGYSAAVGFGQPRLNV